MGSSADHRTTRAGNYIHDRLTNGVIRPSSLETAHSPVMSMVNATRTNATPPHRGLRRIRSPTFCIPDGSGPPRVRLGQQRSPATSNPARSEETIRNEKWDTRHHRPPNHIASHPFSPQQGALDDRKFYKSSTRRTCYESNLWCTELSARRVSAADTLFTATGSPMATFGSMVPYHEAGAIDARNKIGDKGFQTAFDHGRNLTLDDAIARALREQPLNRSPKTTADAAMLTPRELQVAELVAQGLTNRAIATYALSACG